MSDPSDAVPGKAAAPSSGNSRLAILLSTAMVALVVGPKPSGVGEVTAVG